MAEGAWLLWRGCVTGLRNSWLLEVLVVLPFLPPRIMPMLKSGANVVRKTHGFREGSCGVFSKGRTASLVERAASTSRLSKRMFRGWMSSTWLNWRAPTPVVLFDEPGLPRQVSGIVMRRLARLHLPLWGLW